MMKTKYSGIHHTIGHRTAILENLRFSTRNCDFAQENGKFRSYSSIIENPPYSPIQTFAQRPICPLQLAGRIWGLDLL
jgi:hypothetical protein